MLVHTLGGLFERRNDATGQPCSPLSGQCQHRGQPKIDAQPRRHI